MDLRVDSGPPLKVNSDQTVTNLSADKLDGRDSSDLGVPRAYAFVEIDVAPDRSKGVNDVLIPEGESNTNLYCFDLTFTPDIAVGSPFINNSAVVATATRSDEIPGACPAPNRDAAARTYASEDGSAAPSNFHIAFV